MQFSPLSEAYGLKKKQPPKKSTKEPMVNSEPVPPKLAAAAAGPPVAPAPAPAPVPTKIPIKLGKRKRNKESFLCRFTDQEKTDLILIMQFLNFAILIYLLWTRRNF